MIRQQAAVITTRQSNMKKTQKTTTIFECPCAAELWVEQSTILFGVLHFYFQFKPESTLFVKYAKPAGQTAQMTYQSCRTHGAAK